ncbi:MAG: GNAT family N-acetyltransferase [Deltaproteobacteria bacterium]|nr:GNAT family N-acetyltransferase [Deltaproteobacteria bacterium]
MRDHQNHMQWQQRVISPKEALAHIRPGMSIFVGSGVAEPRTLTQQLFASNYSNINDLELIQLTSHADFLSLKKLDYQRYRLKTFFSTWISSEAVIAGNVDLIPGRFSQIPELIKSNRIPIDVAFVQISPPNSAGYCSMGVAVDVAREAMYRASLVVGEINTLIPFTLGDTIVSLSDFDLLVEATVPPLYFKRHPVKPVMNQVAANIAQIIQDGDCINFYTGALFEALSLNLRSRHHLGIHTIYFTDALMDLVKSGAVSNYRKEVFRGKSVTSYALGTPRLLEWLDRNPVVEFQSIGQVLNPIQLGRNPNFVVIQEAKRIDLLGRISFSVGKGSLLTGPSQAVDLFTGTELSPGGRAIVGLPSRNNRGAPNIVVMLRDLRNQFHMRESIDAVVTEYGIANLKWRTLKERALSLIDIAHPDDREALIQAAKENRILSPDQSYPINIGRLYPLKIKSEHVFKGGVKIRFRPTRPSDETAMRHLFYRFSKSAIHSRFFFPISIMPHKKMQAYVNIDYRTDISVVALLGEPKNETIIAEARFAKIDEEEFGDLAFFVDEAYHGLGIASYMYRMLIQMAKDKGLKGLVAEILEHNKAMLQVFEKGELKVFSQNENGFFKLAMPFKEDTPLPKGYTAKSRDT